MSGTPDHLNHSSDVERALEAIERHDAALRLSPRDEAMRRDRSVLKSALASDLSRPLARDLAARFDQTVRDEIDRSLLSSLSEGRAVDDHLPVSRVIPKRTSALSRFAIAARERLSPGVLAAAACLALVAGGTWLVLHAGPGPIARPIAANPPSRTVPGWATLPDLPDAPIVTQKDPVLAVLPGIAPTTPDREVFETRDVATALAWARRGVLALRITTDAPRRDREHLDVLAARDPRQKAWILSNSPPPGLGALHSNPWPIDTHMADADGSGAPPTDHSASATVAGYDLFVRPTLEALQDTRDELERMIRGTVSFERVDALTAYPAPVAPLAQSPQAVHDIIWWRKPVDQWSPRISVPVLLEFGTPVKAAPGSK